MSQDHQRRKERRRKVLPGYPKEGKFETPEELAEYFEADRITCLLCGKRYRTLGVHLRTVHNTSPDEYRERHGIPWTYGLACGENKAKHADHALHLIESGAWIPSEDQAKMARMAKGPQERERPPVRETLAARNLAKMNDGKTGNEAARRAAAPKRGTTEYREVMQNREQCKNPPDAFKYWWSGKEQDAEHVLKRTGHNKKKP